MRRSGGRSSTLTGGHAARLAVPAGLPCGAQVVSQLPSTSCSPSVRPTGSAAYPSCLPPPPRSVHPTPHGNMVLAELLREPLIRAVMEVAAGHSPQLRGDPRVPALPPPMIPRSPDLTASQCYMLVRLGGAALGSGAEQEHAQDRLPLHSHLLSPLALPYSAPRPAPYLAQHEFEPLVKAKAGFEYKAERPFAADFVVGGGRQCGVCGLDGKATHALPPPPQPQPAARLAPCPGPPCRARSGATRGCCRATGRSWSSARCWTPPARRRSRPCVSGGGRGCWVWAGGVRGARPPPGAAGVPLNAPPPSCDCRLPPLPAQT